MYLRTSTLLTSAQRSAEVRALQRALSFYISIFQGMYVPGRGHFNFICTGGVATGLEN